MRNLLFLGLLIAAVSTNGQITFSDSTQLLLQQNFTTFIPVGITDMNGDKKDDIIRIENGQILSIEYQVTGSSFTNSVIATVSQSGVWGMCVADFDQNGYNDIFTGGAYDTLKLLMADNTGSSYTMNYLSDTLFLQGCNFADINNDGWLDIFACHDDAGNLPYRNDGAGNPIGDPNLIQTLASSGNYASVWFDLENDGDIDLYISKCRGGVFNSNDPRRINLLYRNDGAGVFTEIGAQAGVADGSQSWTSDFGDIDNDGDMDLYVVNHSASHKLFENNGDGTFTDITANANIFTNAFQDDYQCIFRDFDNDGWVDLLISGGNNSLWMNNGDKTFTEATNAFPITNDEFSSFAVGDLNTDGFIDIYAVYTSQDYMLFNDGNNNNWLIVNLVGTASNWNGVGSRLELYGSWGKQIREVRAGESYGIQNSLNQHFGLGTETQIDSLVVRWPSGAVDVMTGFTNNTCITVTETPVGIQENTNAKHIGVYPNPSSGILFIDNPYPVEISVTDQVGHVLISRFTRSNIDLSDLPAGIYFVKIKTENSVTVNRVVLTR